MAIEKRTRILKELNYYFFYLPLFVLFSRNNVYKKLDSWVRERRIEEERKTKVINNLKLFFKESFSEIEYDLLGERYFSILSCDDIDTYLQLFKPWKINKKFIKVEGKEIFEEIVKQGKGCVLLTAHYGGAFFIFNIIKEAGGKPQFLLRPIRREYLKKDISKRVFMKLRIFSVRKAIGERMIFTGEKETKNRILQSLKKGYHIVIMFDVPPFFIKGKSIEVYLLGKKWYFPYGFLELLIGRDFAVIPFFTFMNDQWERIFQFYPPFWIEKNEDLLDKFQQSVNIFEEHLRKRPEQWFFWDDAQVFWEKKKWG